MSIVLPAINSFESDNAREIALGHQIQDDIFAESQQRLSIPGREYTAIIAMTYLASAVEKNKTTVNNENDQF